MPNELAPWVCIGDFGVRGVGQLRVYLPEDPARPRTADRGANVARFTLVHPDTQPDIATVTGLGAEDPEWTKVPDSWSAATRQAVIANAWLFVHVVEVSG